MSYRRAIFLFWAGFFLLPGCSKQQPPASIAEKVVTPPEETIADYGSTLPKVGQDANYVGSSACRECHQDQYSSWHRSYHRTMTQVASEESVQADFNNVVLATENERVTLKKVADEFTVRIEPAGQSAENVAGIEQRLGLVTGSHHMQVFWVPAGEGNLQIGFPFTWLIPEKRWVPRNSTFLRPPDLGHTTEVWNVVCTRCHTTAVKPKVDFAKRTGDTEVAELGISCEACHGPGQRHAATQKEHRDSGGKGLAADEIIHPKKLSPERSAQVCGFCHSMKWIDKSENWRQNGFRFRPGDDLEQTTPIIRPSKIDAIAGLRAYLRKNPAVLDEFFWPDGMIRVSGREYNGLLESPCYKGGKFSCLSCHSLHESDPDDQLMEKARGNGACLQCHERFRDPANLTAHTRHRENSSGSECYNCHMPHTTYGILKSIRSHQISSPKVADELATGRPNACNLCHLDKSLAWTANQLNTWFGEQKPQMPASNHSRAAELALTGDAGQRALLAWHLAWPPALEVSGTNWVIPFLGQLLDDPYAAVRCVAERSLRTLSENIPVGYDFALDARTRPGVREKVWSAWNSHQASAAIPPELGLLLTPDNLAKQGQTFDQWLINRDNSPIRLRE